MEHLAHHLAERRKCWVLETATVSDSLILVVDDFPATREMYGRFLGYSGFHVEEASSGPEALKKSFTLKPQIIIMDLTMPGMDGWEAIRKLKADERTRHTPIVVVTGASFSGGAQKAKDAGCDAYLVKPCLPETLLGVVRSLLDKRDT